MQIEEIRPLNFIYHRSETSIPELARFIEQDVVSSIQRDALAHGMRITGPVYWNYFDFTGDPSASFILDISVPVHEMKEEYKGDFQLKRTDPFKCVSAVHHGPWTDIPQTYARIFQFISKQNLQPNGRNREIYLNVDFLHHEANITHIQVGIN